jgi:hypothetical protein
VVSDARRSGASRCRWSAPVPVAIRLGCLTGARSDHPVTRAEEPAISSAPDRAASTTRTGDEPPGCGSRGFARVASVHAGDLGSAGVRVRLVDG